MMDRHSLLLFAGGLLLGVLLSLSLSATFSPLSAPPTTHTHTAHTTHTQPAVPLTAHSGLRDTHTLAHTLTQSEPLSLTHTQPHTLTATATQEAAHTTQATHTPDNALTQPTQRTHTRWAPGRAADIDKLRSEALSAQHMMQADTNTDKTPANARDREKRSSHTHTDTQSHTQSHTQTHTPSVADALAHTHGLSAAALARLRKREAALRQRDPLIDENTLKLRLTEVISKLDSKASHVGTNTDQSHNNAPDNDRNTDKGAVRPTAVEARAQDLGSSNNAGELLVKRSVTTVGATTATAFALPRSASLTHALTQTAQRKIQSLPLPHTQSVVNSSYSREGSRGAHSNRAPAYHEQALSERESVYLPTLQDAQKEGKAPSMKMQRGVHEPQNLKLHLCNGVFEAYSAAYLTTAQHMINVASESYNLSWVNCEMASFIHMKEGNKFYSQPQTEGMIMQTLDVLDFSVIHLSAYERSSKRHKDLIWSKQSERKTLWKDIRPVVTAGEQLRALNDPTQRNASRSIKYSREALRTVVVMPFLGGAMGAGHSELNNRFRYLETCFWSLFEFFPFIVIAVSRKEDVEWALLHSDLPFYEVLLIENLPKSAGLPVGLTQHTKARLAQGMWDFDFVFFSESDQILISRELPLLYEHLKMFPGHMLLPHRLMPYSHAALTNAHKRTLSEAPHILPTQQTWTSQSCCMPRQNCVERKTWKSLKDEAVPVIDYYGLYVPLGNVNFLDESYRACTLSPYVDYCP